MNRVAAVVALAVASIAVGVGVVHFHNTDAATAELRAAAAPADLYVAPSGLDTAACTQAAPCKTFDRAYHLAQPGQVVEVAAGSYGSQTMTVKTGAAAPNVLVRSAAGATISLTHLQFNGASYVTFKGDFRIANANDESLFFEQTNPLTNVTIDGFTISGLNGKTDVVKVQGNTSNLTIRNSDICCNTDQKLVLTDNYSTTSTFPPANRNLTLEYNRIHGQTMSSATVHAECLYISGMDGFTLRGNVIYGCIATGDMIYSLTGGADQTPTGYLIENNYWGTAHNNVGQETAYSIQGCTPPGTVYRNNIFDAEVVRCATQTDAGIKYVNNLGYRGSCGAATYDDNIWTTLRCSGDRPPNANALSPSIFRNAAAWDFHAASGSSPQVDQGDPANFAPFDADGTARPLGAGPDVGMYEFAATPPPTTTAVTTTAPTTTAATTTTPTTTITPSYAPLCAPTCDEQIAALKQRIANATAALNP